MPAPLDAYRTLQISPQAEDIVLEAAYRALARRYHPDGETPDEARMAEINRAYDLLRSPVSRRRYDRNHNLRPFGPGLGTVVSAGQPVTPAEAPPTNGGPAVLDFGRYEGWSLKDLAKHDPDYLRWLARSSGGYRFRTQILQLLPEEVVARSRF